MKKEFLTITLVIFSLFFISCSKQKVLVSDRHVYSYEIVKNQVDENNCSTLILLDYHNDIKSDTYNLTSYNWVSKLIEEDVITKVYWISGGVLNTLNRNARMNWLTRNLVDFDVETEDKIRNVITLLDFDELKHYKFKQKVIITLDFDVLTKNPGPDDMQFLNDMNIWIKKQNCPLLTLSFSSIYQDVPSKAYNWFYTFIKNYDKKSHWYFLSSDFVEKAESNEELKAWQKWEQNPDFYNYEEAFFENGYLWLQFPFRITQELLNKKIKPYKNDKISEEIINCWKSENFQTLQKDFTKEKLIKYAKIAAEQIQNNDYCPCPEIKNIFLDENNLGIAVRFFRQNENYKKDRGCLALYFGLSKDNVEEAVKYCAQQACNDPRYYPISKDEINDLFINISVFSKWEKMNDYNDFVPGSDSVLIINKNATDQDRYITLLQPAIALERNYDKENFLECLCKKAGLNEKAYKTSDYEFYKSKTLTYYTFLMNLL